MRPFCSLFFSVTTDFLYSNFLHIRSVFSGKSSLKMLSARQLQKFSNFWSSELFFWCFSTQSQYLSILAFVRPFPTAVTTQLIHGRKADTWEQQVFITLSCNYTNKVSSSSKDGWSGWVIELLLSGRTPVRFLLTQASDICSSQFWIWILDLLISKRSSQFSKNYRPTWLNVSQKRVLQRVVMMYYRICWHSVLSCNQQTYQVLSTKFKVLRVKALHFQKQ